MFNSRTPTAEMLSSLDRDSWEQLCQSVCTVTYSAHRVEDRFGKGNGLDAWRISDESIEGWQFRRLNERFGALQAKGVKDNLKLANIRAISEMGLPLSKFVFIPNIDPEPGHSGSIGEIQRLEEIRQWANDTHQVDFSYQGVSWVRAILLKHPYLLPDAFEDLVGAVDSARDEILGRTDTLSDQMQSLIERLDSSPVDIASALRTLIDQAQRHYQRGQDLLPGDHFVRAIQSLDDAWQLVEEHDVDPELKIRIVSLLAGTEATVGMYDNAVEHGKIGVQLCSQTASVNDHSTVRLRALGNLGFAQYMNQEFGEGRVTLALTLAGYEELGDAVGIIKTTQHLAELEMQDQKPKSALPWLERLQSATDAHKKLTGHTELTLSALATQANFMSLMGQMGLDPTGSAQAVTIFASIQESAHDSGLKRLEVFADFQRSVCLWHSDDLVNAAIDLRRISAGVIDEFPKVAADAMFNLALLLREQAEYDESDQILGRAREVYSSIGDLPSVSDVDRIISRPRNQDGA